MAFRKGSFVLDLVATALTTGGAAGSVLNPEGAQVIITKTTLWMKTQPTGSANLNVGIGATAATDASNLISGLAVGSSTGKAYNGLNPAANSEQAVWDADEYLNVTGDATTVGMEGRVYVEYVHV